MAFNYPNLSRVILILWDHLIIYLDITQNPYLDEANWLVVRNLRATALSSPISTVYLCVIWPNGILQFLASRPRTKCSPGLWQPLASGEQPTGKPGWMGDTGGHWWEPGGYSTLAGRDTRQEVVTKLWENEREVGLITNLNLFFDSNILSIFHFFILFYLIFFGPCLNH